MATRKRTHVDLYMRRVETPTGGQRIGVAMNDVEADFTPELRTWLRGSLPSEGVRVARNTPIPPSGWWSVEQLEALWTAAPSGWKP